MKNPYDIIGLPKGTSERELTEKYNELKAEYGEQRFKDGDEGNKGAELLSQLEEAWVLISSDIMRKKEGAAFGGDFGAIDQLIKDGKLEEAQSRLDSISERTAEWNYYQSIVYYKREWLSESRAQLALAVSQDPSNKKYSEALEKMDMVMANPNVRQENLSGVDGPVRQDSTSNMLCRCCTTYLCIDCCLSCCCR